MTTALAALLLLSGTGPAAAADAKSLTAILLSARAELPDDNFADALVLVMNNLGPAPVGIIVNRPTHFTVAQLFPQFKRLAPLHDKIYYGGPVETDTVWFLVRTNKPPAHAVRAFEGVYLSASRDLLFQLLGRSKPMEGLRIFIGHSGWAPGQLETEIGRGDWAMQRADPDAIFRGKPEHPWPGTEEPKDST